MEEVIKVERRGKGREKRVDGRIERREREKEERGR